MIETLKISGFKSFREISLTLGPLNLLIGPNSSGKSNLFDALRVLQGIGYGFTLSEILDGRPQTASSLVWEQIRGGSREAAFQAVSAGPLPDAAVSISLSARLSEPAGTKVNYTIGFFPKSGLVAEERLELNGRQVYDSTPVPNDPQVPVFKVQFRKEGGRGGMPPHLQFARNRPVLPQILGSGKLSKTQRDSVEAFSRLLGGMQRVDPSPAVLREYSKAQHAPRMGEHGENFAAVINSILANDAAKSAYLEWLRQLTPTEVDDVKIMSGALNEPLFALREGGRDVPAPVLSDGTLRFAAITAVFFQPDPPNILTLEEIENGIHPARLRLLVELLRSQTTRIGRQVIATTHSPTLLSWLQESELRTAFLCRRLPETGESEIVPLSEIADFATLLKKNSLGDLLSEGWMEAVQ